MSEIQELIRWLKETNNYKAHDHVLRFTELSDKVRQAFRDKWEDQDE